MFDKSRSDKVADQAKEKSAYVRDQLRDNVVPAVGHAAEQTRDWAQPRVSAAKEWAAPRVQRGINAAAPRVEQAVDAATPKIDAARDKIVDDVLPRLVDAINAATAQAAAARDEAASRSSDAVAVLKGDAVAKPKRHRGRKLLMLGGLLAAAGGAFAAFKRGGLKDDPWATSTDTLPSWASNGATSASTANTPGAVPGQAPAPAADTIDISSAETAETAAADLGTAQAEGDAPDGDQPGKIEPSASARRSKPRDDG